MATSNESSSSKPENKLKVVQKAIHDFLHEKNSFTYVFELVEKYIKVKREYLFLALIGALVVYLVVGYGAGLVVNLLGFVYPAYKSCKAIDSEEKDDDTQWLTYWVVYAAFGILEYFTDLFLSWVPFYFLIKCAFLIWCMMPMANNGSMFVYHKLIKPFVKKHEKTFEAAMDLAEDAAKAGAKKVAAKAKEAIGQVDLNKIQEMKEMADSFTKTEEDKKDE